MGHKESDTTQRLTPISVVLYFFLEGRWLERGHFILSLSYFLTFAPSNFFSTLSLEGAFYNANLIVTFSPENLSVASNDTRFSHIRF